MYKGQQRQLISMRRLNIKHGTIHNLKLFKVNFNLFFLWNVVYIVQSIPFFDYSEKNLSKKIAGMKCCLPLFICLLSK